jgi:hypothetical protein
MDFKKPLIVNFQKPLVIKYIKRTPTFEIKEMRREGIWNKESCDGGRRFLAISDTFVFYKA